jgi:hypothetical protein
LQLTVDHEESQANGLNEVDSIPIEFYRNNAAVDLTPEEPSKPAKNKEYDKDDLEDKHSFSDTHLEDIEREPEDYPKHTGVRSLKGDNSEFDKGVHRGVIKPIEPIEENVASMEDTTILNGDNDMPPHEVIILDKDVEINGEVFEEGTVIKILEA